MLQNQKSSYNLFLCILWHLNVLVLSKSLGVLIFMTLVYDKSSCEQAIFTYTFSGQNLNNNNIVFTVKKLVNKFKHDFPLLFESDFKTCGRPKKYYLNLVEILL